MIALTLSACALGLASGVRHAVEPDHVAAVGSFVASGSGTRGAVGYAAAWGAGHGVTLVGLAVPLALLGASLSPRTSNALELLVAATLLVLGVRGLLLARAGATHAVPRPPSRMAFAVGLVHGLAGSGALAALVASTLPSIGVAIAFITVYALGAAVGMSALAGVLGIPLARLASGRRALAVVSGCAASLSLVVGVVWAARVLAGS